MSNQAPSAKNLSKKIRNFSYAIATIYLITALAGVAYSIYALIALKKIVFSYITIALSGLLTIAAILQFFTARHTHKSMVELRYEIKAFILLVLLISYRNPHLALFALKH